MKISREITSENTLLSQEKEQRLCNAEKKVDFKVRDLVLIRMEQVRPNVKKKLVARYQRNGQINTIGPSNIYRVRTSNRKEEWINSIRLKEFILDASYNYNLPSCVQLTQNAELPII